MAGALRLAWHRRRLSEVAKSNDCLVESEQGGFQYSGHLADPLQLLPLDRCVAALIKTILVGVSLSECKGGRQAESVCSFWHGSIYNPQLFCGANARFNDRSAPLVHARAEQGLHAVMLDEDQQVAAKVRRRKASLARDLRQGACSYARLLL
eukprot:SM000138S00049  [mRNA]  locus=s138:250826:256528:+ [translate_table: standard]